MHIRLTCASIADLLLSMLHEQLGRVDRLELLMLFNRLLLLLLLSFEFALFLGCTASSIILCCYFLSSVRAFGHLFGCEREVGEA